MATSLVETVSVSALPRLRSRPAATAARHASPAGSSVARLNVRAAVTSIAVIVPFACRIEMRPSEITGTPSTCFRQVAWRVPIIVNRLDHGIPGNGGSTDQLGLHDYVFRCHRGDRACHFVAIREDDLSARAATTTPTINTTTSTTMSNVSLGHPGSCRPWPRPPSAHCGECACEVKSWEFQADRMSPRAIAVLTVRRARSRRAHEHAATTSSKQLTDDGARPQQIP